MLAYRIPREKCACDQRISVDARILPFTTRPISRGEIIYFNTTISPPIFDDNVKMVAAHAFENVVRIALTGHDLHDFHTHARS